MIFLIQKIEVPYESAEVISQEVLATDLGHARGKPRLFNSRDESERFFCFSTKGDICFI